MKGKLFVIVYSVILIGLFTGCCYLMSTVNPAPLPDSSRRKNFITNESYPSDYLPRRGNLDYGLEKIPEGVDADEFRKHIITTKYDLEEMEKNEYEPGKKVVPPIWPSDHILENNIVKQNHNGSNFNNIVTAPIKGHRRSVHNDHIDNLKVKPSSILLKIVDDSGHKKIEIKFIPRENIKTKKLRKNRSPNNLKSNNTDMKRTKSNESTTQKNYDDNDKVIQVKADDVILLTIVDDSDVALDKNNLFDANNTEDVPKLVTNITDLNYPNKTWNHVTKIGVLDEGEKKLKEELLDKEMYNFSVLFNNDNRNDTKSINDRGNNSDALYFTKAFASMNDTGISSETMPHENRIENSTREIISKIY